MTMNAYDFDKTIYRRDCSVTFYLWCVRHYPRIALRWPRLACDAALYGMKRITKHVFMERLYQYLHDVPDVSAEVERFWDRNEDDVHVWYKKAWQLDDLIISASPDFLVRPAAARLGVRRVLASPLNPATGLYEGERCHGEGKVRMLNAAYPGAQIEAFYSDSLSDAPMARIAEKAYLVHGEQLSDWPKNEDGGYEG